MPSELGNLTALQFLLLYNNSLTGSLPSELGLLTRLQRLIIYQNIFHGSLPSELGLMSLSYLATDINSFDGSIPSELGNLTALQVLSIYDNSLTGSLPSELGLLTRLVYLGADNNKLEGSLPSELGNLKGLIILTAANNSLGGSLPSEMGLMGGLKEINLQSNSLTGSLPSELGLLTNLEILSIFSNSLEGSLPSELFTKQASLILFDVHDNYLQGRVPTKLPPRLKILSLSKNCFTGSLAASLCEDAASLSYLLLDGLSSGSACQKRIWPDDSFGFNALWSTSRMSGSIPSCIYSIPSLQKLHISGNGLRGSLVAHPASWSANLTELSLSHNVLTGKPPSLRHILWLDLSYNRLSGTLDGFRVASNYSGRFALDVNRLSGHVPAAVTGIKGKVRILQGNLFECSWLNRRDSLPTADPAYGDYSCGSHSIDIYLFVFTASFAVLLTSYCCLALKWRSTLYWLAWRNKEARKALQNRPISIQAALFRVRSVAVLAGLVLLLFLPLYGALKPFFGTYEFQYAWTVAAIMLSGTTPAAVLLAFWMLTLAVASAGVLIWFRDLKGSTAATVAPEAENLPTLSERCRLVVRLVTLATLNIIVAGVANISFVVVTVGDYSTAVTSLAAVALGLYKTAWIFLFPFIIDSEALLLGVDRAVEGRSRFLKAGDLFRTLLQIVNAVVMPALAVAVTDPSCFKNILFAAPSIRSSYNIALKIPLVGMMGTFISSAEVDFTPSFSYSYECTSTLVEKFAPVFAQVALTSAFVIPLLAAVARSALDSLQRRGVEIPGLRGALMAMLPSLLLYRKSERDEPGCFQFLRPKAFIKADEVLRQTVTDVALMLSIGLVAPLLGLMFATSIVSRCLMWEYLIDRFLSMPDEHLEGDVQALKEQCLQIGASGKTPLYNARWLLVIFPSLFLALVGSDIAGDSVGIENALWAPILMALLPSAVLFALTRVFPGGSALSLDEASEWRLSFAPSEIVLAPISGNPLHRAIQTFDAAELDHIPNPSRLQS